MRFFVVETSRAPALSLIFCRRKQKYLPLALRAREKIWARLVGKSNCLYFTYLHALNLRAYVHENYATVKINPWEKFQNLRGFECKTTQPWLGGKSCFFLYKSFKSFGGRCNRCFLDIRLKCYRLPSFNTRFQIPLLILFRSSLQKVYHMTNYCEGLLN